MARRAKQTGRVATQKEAARLLGITARQLRDWEKEDWWPAGARKASGYDVAAIRAARDQAGRKGSEQSEEARRVRLARDEERLKRERLRTEREALDLKRARGELIPRGAVELFASTFLTEFGDWCDTLPAFAARLAGKKNGRRVREKLKEELDGRRVLMRDALRSKAREFQQEALETHE